MPKSPFDRILDKKTGLYYPAKPLKEFLVYDNGLSREKPDNYLNYTSLNIDMVVVKAGTNILTHKDRNRTITNMRCIAEDITELKDVRGYDFYLLHSGAIAEGRKQRLRLGICIPEIEKDSAKQKQQDAIYGQPKVYGEWEIHFYPQRTKESLLTHKDLSDKNSRKRVFNGYKEWLKDGVIPVINEDDKRSLEEIEDKNKLFRDNDGLSSLIAQCLKKDGHNPLLIILTNTDGLYSKESYDNGSYEPIRIVRNPDGMEKQISTDKSKSGRGGALSKVMAARDAANAGVPVVIANGMYCNHDSRYRTGKLPNRRYKVLNDILRGKVVGTRFMPK